MLQSVSVLTFALLGMLGAVGEATVDDADEKAVLRWFREIAEDVARSAGVHIEFSVDYSNEHRGLHAQYVGVYDYDARTGRAYLWTTRLPSQQTALAVRKDYYSWNTEFGMHKIDDPAQEDLHVIKEPTVPDGMGYAHFPSDHIYYQGQRSLASYLETHRTVTAAIEPNSIYRIAVANGDPKLEIPPSWRVFLIRKEPGDPPRVVEERLYFDRIPEQKPGVPIAEPEVAVPDGFELPSEFHAAFLHWRKVYERFKVIDRKPMPVRWRLEIPHGKVRAVIEIDEDTLRLAPESDHDFTVPLDEDDIVFDTVARLTQRAGAKEYEFPTDGMVTEGQLDELLREAAAEFKSAESTMANAYIPMGCAADCTYLALATLKRPYPLHRIASELGIRPGSPRTDLRTVCAFFERQSVDTVAVSAARSTLEHIFRKVGNIPLVVHEKTEHWDHFLAVRDYRAEDDTLQILNPLESPYREDRRSIQSRSSGTVLIVDPAVIPYAVELVERSANSRLSYIGGVCASVIGLLALLFGFSRRRMRKTQ